MKQAKMMGSNFFIYFVYSKPARKNSLLKVQKTGQLQLVPISLLPNQSMACCLTLPLPIETQRSKGNIISALSGWFECSCQEIYA
jgi:hypothetical protein